MTNRAKWQQHCRRWDITPDGDEFYRFRNRVLVALEGALNLEKDDLHRLDKTFSMWAGEQPDRDPLEEIQADVAGVPLRSTRLYRAAASAGNLVRLATVLQWVFWAIQKQADHTEMVCKSRRKLLEKSAPEAQTRVKDLQEGIGHALGLSPGVEIKLVRRGNAVTLFPAGAKALDEAVVEDVLGFLGRHPKVAERFEHLLRTYLAKDSQQARNVLDDLRFCLEQLLQEILKNGKTLENQTADLGAWLKGRGVHVQVRNMFGTLLAHFTGYHNKGVKHPDGLPARPAKEVSKGSRPEIEFMLYLTGTFMRMLLELERNT